MLELVQDARSLDDVAARWRDGPEWAFKTLDKWNVEGDAALIATFPASIQLHSDVWNAYEWNYHRTARIVMHMQLVACIRRAISIAALSSAPTDITRFSEALEHSTNLIRQLADDVFATVPQTFGEINHLGRVLRPDAESPKCRGVGGYLLLWPIKIIKSEQCCVTEQQRTAAITIFERIRDYTGMKAELGSLSMI